MIDVLLINPPSAFSTYKGTKVDAYVQVYPVHQHLTEEQLAYVVNTIKKFYQS